MFSFTVLYISCCGAPRPVATPPPTKVIIKKIDTQQPVNQGLSTKEHDYPLPQTFKIFNYKTDSIKTINNKKNLSKDELWKLIEETLADEYEFDYTNKSRGSIKTKWKYTYILPHTKRTSDRYRTCINLSFEGDNWQILKIKSEAQWFEDKKWIKGYDTKLLEDVFNLFKELLE